MKTLSTTVLLLFLFSFSTVFAARSPHEKSPAFAHLSEVNAQWLKHEKDAPAADKTFATDVDRIQYHLVLVEKFLKANTPSGFTVKALKNRARLLDKLKEYAAAKSFPVNTYHAVRRPYFIDNYGTYCAVGYLISVSGNDALAKRINAEHRYDYIHDINTAGLKEWASSHGFTVDELAWIQPGYMPSTSFTSVGTGTDGPIEGMCSDYWGNRVLFHGNFGKVNNMPCLNIGQYSEGQLSCFGTGITGQINDLGVRLEDVYASGDLYHEGKNYPLAMYDGVKWNYIEIPGREGAVGKTLFENGRYLEVAISHGFNPYSQEVWYFNEDDGLWIKKLTVEGEIFGIGYTNYSTVYAGAFSKITAHRGNDDTVILAHNIAFNDYRDNSWTTAQGRISDSVFVVKEIGGAVYFGGAGSSEPGRSDVCLARYMNGSLQTMIKREDFYSDEPARAAIYTLDLYNDADLLIGGDFRFMPMMGETGLNLGMYSLVYNSMGPKGVLDGNIKGMVRYGGSWLLGGSFTKNWGSGEQDLNHLAAMDVPSSIGDEKESKISVYPNPASTSITIDIGNDRTIKSLRITDMVGRSMMNSASLNASNTFDISSLKPGMYVLTVETTGRQQLQKTFSVK